MALHVLDEANRCLGCKKPLCQQGCPIHTNIPEVIRLLKANQMDEAGRMLFENNPLTTVCALVCNHENQCEGHCVRNRMPSHDPVHFSIIEDYISTTYANKMTAGPAPKNGMKAAVVGSGPAGLTIAVLLIYRLVFNLVENGIKYNRPGGAVRVTLQQEKQTAVLRVADTGPGIPADCRESIFQPFFRVDKSRSREMGGVGLGLALVREIAVLHGGSVTVERSSENGTTFAYQDTGRACHRT